MKPNIMIEWRENGEVYQKQISRQTYIKWILRLIKQEKPNHQLFVVKALAGDADMIYADADNKKQICFKYDETREYEEKHEQLDILENSIVYYFVESYCKGEIVFLVIENKELRVTRKSKEEVVTIMKTIRDCYSDNNQISTKLSEILPETYIISVNKDRNDDLVEPLIICETLKETIPVGIINHHKIIWAHLNNWCE